MLSQEENELLTRVGPGTPMGEMLRRYWLPALLSSELPEPDGYPLRRLRLLGESLVAFRDSNGRIGVLGEHCPHRGASLFFARNEECGLRCVYHGWKFDAEGNCLDMPNEPSDSAYRAKIKQVSYRTRERNGMIWVYMGSAAEPPALPDLEWNLYPESHGYISKRIQKCNWAQALEGGIDSSHVPFLHGKLETPSTAEDLNAKSYLPNSFYYADRTPQFEILETEYGCHIASRRNAGPDDYYWRINEFLMPFHTLLPPTTLAETPTWGAHAWVPVDDETCVTWSMNWSTKPLSAEEMDFLRNGNMLHAAEKELAPETSAPEGKWSPAGNLENDYLIDYEVQRTKFFTGIPHLWLQDHAIQESMGPIYDRRNEHLGASDAGVIKARQMWLRSARALRDHGTLPPGLLQPQSYRIHPIATVLPRSEPWLEALKDQLFVTGAPL
jgi:phthalate 4,5-dioxygenase oxygenase subunit